MNTENNTPISPNDSDGKPKWLTRKEYIDPAEKKRDFWIGVAIFFVLNIVLTLCQWGLGFGLLSAPSNFAGTDSASSTLASIFYLVFALAPWVINIGLIIYFAFTRSQIALGMVAGFGIALAIVICLGVIFTVWCFATLSAGSY
ncbi:MAG TPA: hypothetical protein PKK96_00095 [Anaerolineales bacterium]|nr:hypothetical protein [Anaerolineales bacterium]HMS00760.1 hypothetical protein [Anaerolineales bacterium]HNQ95169.1 hypothetical protein [Anaerolineales bacterium]HNS59374.1 hypothetical protein [Anaerolineales bacterium]